MYYALMKNGIYLTDVSKKTLEKLVNNKSKFKGRPRNCMLQERRMLLTSKRNYPIHDKELFAIVHALKNGVAILSGSKISQF